MTTQQATRPRAVEGRLLVYGPFWIGWEGGASHRLDDPATVPHDRAETVDGDHGRIETRRARVAHDVAWLADDARGGRGLGTAGLAAAADWLEAQGLLD